MDYIGYIIAGVVLLLGIVLLVCGYLKAPPDTAYIISGFRKRRILIGKAGWRIPFFERVDRISLRVMQVDVKTSEAVPTNEFINVSVDGVANVKVSSDEALLLRAAETLLNMEQSELISLVTQVLEGNMREIVGSVGLKEMVQDRQGVAKKITENVVPDMEKLGIEVVNFNIQSFRDSAGTIENMGIDNVEQIRKNAQIAKAIAQRDIAIATAQAQEESNAIKVEAEKKIASRMPRCQSSRLRCGSWPTPRRRRPMPPTPSSRRVSGRPLKLPRPTPTLPGGKRRRSWQKRKSPCGSASWTQKSASRPTP